MAKSASGKWVSRVGASGGGKAYKKTRPSNYYAALVVIVVLGLAATMLARYDYQHPAAATSSTPPAIGTVWYGALSIQSCGVSLPFLNTDPTFKGGGFTVEAADVIRLDPTSSADSGNNATIAQFANEFPGLTISSSELAVPTATGTANSTTTFRNGEVCPKDSKYPGQKGYVTYAYWTTFGQKKPTITTNPASIKFSQDLRITMAFDPKGVTPKPPSTATVDAMEAAVITPTTTTTVATTATTAATATTTTIATTTTTAAKG